MSQRGQGEQAYEAMNLLGILWGENNLSARLVRAEEAKIVCSYFTQHVHLNIIQ